MSSFKWIASSLRNLRITGPGTTSSTGSHVVLARQGSTVTEKKATVGFPERPKRPLSPFMIFSKEIRPKFAKENPLLKPTEISRMLGQRWVALEQHQKDEYSKTFHIDLTDYAIKMEKYNSSLSPEQKEVFQRLRVEKDMRKEKREKTKRLKALGRPRKPPTPFIKYLMEHVPKGTPPKVFQQTCKDLGAKWKELPEDQKAPYVQGYEKEFYVYKKVLAKWENRMMESGNEDLVRRRISKEKDKDEKADEKASKKAAPKADEK